MVMSDIQGPVTWNYRVVEHKDKDATWCDLQEVHYEKDGTIFGYIPVDAIVGNSRDDLEEGLRMMLRDVMSNDLPTLVE